jgi:hypothetical protein
MRNRDALDANEPRPTFTLRIACLCRSVSRSIRDRFIRHRNFEGVLSRNQTGGPTLTSLSRSSTEVLAEYRCGPRTSRIGSCRIVTFGSWWRSQPGPQVSCSGRTQRSFSRPGSQRTTGVSFRSFNFPDRFLRHRNFQLFSDQSGSPNPAADATFFRVQLIDHGPDLNPVDD